MKSMKKYMKKLEIQERTNPGHKTAYVPPLRPRSTSFHSKKEYNRQRAKMEARAEAWA